MKYAIITTIYRKNGVNVVDAHAGLGRKGRDMQMSIFKEYVEKHAERCTGYAIRVASFDSEGEYITTRTTCKVFHKYVAYIHLEGCSTDADAKIFGSNLEQLVREARNAIEGKPQGEAYIQETEAQRKKTGEGIDIIVNNVSGVTRH